MINVKELITHKNPKVLVVTPLLEGHKVSRETKITIKRNEIPFTWITAEGKHNIPINVTLGMNYFKSVYKFLPDYFLMIDRDITLGRNMIDRMYKKLAVQTLPIAYTYADFEYKGYINQDFPAKPFDISNLIQHNYISSNSFFRMDVLQEVGLVVDDQYRRLLDWAFLLKLFRNGYIGIPCQEAKFIVNSTKTDISAGSPEDYHYKRNLVLRDFVKPLTEEFQKARDTEGNTKQESEVYQLDF